jgi:hypothetical protein
MSMLKTIDVPNRIPATGHRRGTTRNLTLALALTGPLFAGACGRMDSGDEYRQGVPYAEDVAIVVPGGEQQADALTAGGVAVTENALLGQQAELYRVTRDATAVVNVGTAAVLALVRTITLFPPTDVGDDVAVWGPHTKALSPNTWRLTVHRLARGQFQYTFEAKPKTEPDTAYLTILSGHHNVADTGGGLLRRRANLPAYGSGDFDLNWDNAQMLPEHDDNVGTAHFVYSRPAADAATNIAVTFHQVMDKDAGMRVDAQYAFVETPASGGSFQFTLTKNEIPTTAALETLTVRSRWQQTGAGRSDVKMVGGDLGASAATVNECWDSNFKSVYMTNSYGDAAKAWGAEASCDAAFPSPDYAVF